MSYNGSLEFWAILLVNKSSCEMTLVGGLIHGTTMRPKLLLVRSVPGAKKK